MPPSSALSLPVSAAPARQLSRANRPRKRKSSAAEFLFCAPAAFTNLLHKTDGSHVNRLLFFLEEKKQKKINCGTAFSSALLRLSPTCYTKRTVHIRTVRFFVPSRTYGKALFLRKTPLPRSVFCFFSSRKENVPLSFLSRKKRKQKKVICGTVALRCCCLFREHTTQNGRFVCEPSSFLFRRKEAKENQLRNSFFFCAPAAFTNLLHKTDGSHVNRPFLCSKQDVRETAFSPKNILPRNVFCFFSSRKENVPLSRKEIVPLQEKKAFPP